MNICIFLPSGKTFTFKDVVGFVACETMLKFQYVAMSDGKQKGAVFQMTNIAGWSTHE